MARIQSFRDNLNGEFDRLEILCEKWQNESLDDSVPEEKLGQILSVIGQTKLLTHDKFQQFRKLIAVYESEETTQRIDINDLQGFWDLINIEIADMDSKFNMLEHDRSTNWTVQYEQPSIPKPIRKIAKKTPTDYTTAAKQRLAEAKAKFTANIMSQFNGASK